MKFIISLIKENKEKVYSGTIIEAFNKAFEDSKKEKIDVKIKLEIYNNKAETEKRTFFFQPGYCNYKKQLCNDCRIPAYAKDEKEFFSILKNKEPRKIEKNILEK
jgi:hypothetical protein